ncbi:hypothetical protein GCM10009611_21600 [Arthrobacter roseus]
MYGVALLLIAYWPSPVDAVGAQTIDTALLWLHDNGGLAWINYALIESLSNVALFLPFGLLVAASLPLQWKWLAVPAGIAISILFEVGQGLFLPDRVSTSQDVLANGFGAALGVVIVYAWLQRKRTTQPRPY